MVRLLLIAVLLVPVLTACESAVRPQKLPDITFAHMPALSLNVAAVEVDSKYRPPIAPPNVEHLFSTTPETAIRRWAADRLKPGGTTGVARLTILNASVTEAELERTTGVLGAFRTEPSEQYAGVVEATLELLDDSGRRMGFATAQARRSRGVIENATLNERELFWHELTEALVRDFDAQMERNIRDHLGGWLQ